MTHPILYSFRRCPYAIRARLAILASGVVCELREVSLANKPEAMVIASPKATIPVMVLPNGAVLDESLDIMTYALGQNDPDGWMVQATDLAMELVTINDTQFKDHLDRYKYPQRYGQDPTVHRLAGLAILADLNAHLGETHFLAGDHCSLVDVAIFPFVRQFAAVDQAWFDEQPIPKLSAWLATFLASKRFELAMASWPIWTPASDVTYFPSSQISV